MEAAVERSNLLCAYERVVKNEGAPGVDGLTVSEFKPWLKVHWPKVRQALLGGEYLPAAVRQVEIAKPQGGVRTLGMPTVLDRLIQQTLKAARGRSLKSVIEQLNPIVRGWVVYFRLTEVNGVLEELDGWLRHKLRSLLWRQWKRNHTRTKNLMRAGRSEQRAWASATNGRGPWWNGEASHMHAAYPKSCFDGMGLVSLLDTPRRFLSVS